MADPKSCLILTPDSIREAHEIIKSHIHRTPVLTNRTLDRIASSPTSPGTPAPKLRLFFKCENYQKIGAFKARGAFYAVKHLVKELGIEEVRRRGVVTHSSGNHAQALALAASTFEIPAYIVMPTISTPSKIAGTQIYTEHVMFSGSTSQEREAKVEEVIKETGAILVPPYDHPDIILGQGTTALELDEQYRRMASSEKHSSESMQCSGQAEVNSSCGGKEEQQLDAIIAPIGGGGLLAGIATYFSQPSRTSGKRTLVFGAEPSFQGGDDARRGLAQGRRIESVKTLTIADGLRTPVGVRNWDVVRDRNNVEDIYAVSEEQIKAAMRLVLERMKVFVEPSACVGLAVALFDEDFRRRVCWQQRDKVWDIGIVFSGGNTTVDAIAGLFGKGEDERDGKGFKREEGKVGINGEKVAENVAG